MLKNRISGYVGIDPTAPSLHLGHLMVLMPLFWMYIEGFGAFSLIGGSTAKIGDPSGRTQDRPTIPPAELVQNLTQIHYQLQSLWKSVLRMSRSYGNGLPQLDWAMTRGIVNNNAWWNKQSMLEVMKLLGSHVRIGSLLSRENVKTRLSDGHGMSFGEFAYPLMQAWDWWQLYKQQNVRLQIGGSDQYSNIVMGAQCVKYCLKDPPGNEVRPPPATMFGLTVPLLTTSTGAKFGKSAGNAVWLDPFRTSPYDLYGYLVRRSDEEVEGLLKRLTFMPLSTIATVMEEHTENPARRVAQHTLAHNVVNFVHGSDKADEVQLEHRQMYGSKPFSEPTTSGELPPQSAEQYEMSEDFDPTQQMRPRIQIRLPRSLLEKPLPVIVHAAELAISKGEADRLIKGGGMYIGGAPGQKIMGQKGMNSDSLTWTPLKTWLPEFNDRFLVEGRIMLLRKGKHNIRCIEFISDEEFSKAGLRYRGQSGMGKTRQALQVMKTLQKLLMKKKKVDPADMVLQNRVNRMLFAMKHQSLGRTHVSIPRQRAKGVPYRSVREKLEVFLERTEYEIQRDSPLTDIPKGFNHRPLRYHKSGMPFQGMQRSDSHSEGMQWSDSHFEDTQHLHSDDFDVEELIKELEAEVEAEEKMAGEEGAEEKGAEQKGAEQKGAEEEWRNT